MKCNEFEGQHVLVTGGARGIGRALVLAFAKHGADVAINYISSDEAATSLKREVEKIGRCAILVKGSVATKADSERIVEQTVTAFGKMDVLINNAGIVKNSTAMLMSVEDWQAVVDTNLTGAFLMAKAAVKKMLKKRQGNIINMASVAGMMGLVASANYCAAKAGLFGLTKTMAREMARYNIRINAVAPGFVETDLIASMEDKHRDYFKDHTLVKRFGTLEEIAAAVLYLASADASYITGQTLVVDGGLSLSPLGGV